MPIMSRRDKRLFSTSYSYLCFTVRKYVSLEDFLRIFICSNKETQELRDLFFMRTLWIPLSSWYRRIQRKVGATLWKFLWICHLCLTLLFQSLFGSPSISTRSTRAPEGIRQILWERGSRVIPL